ncbi:teneurin-a-like [Ixodes scapularis]|uniref:teneurin-a-like n=1 Tax=Ixodes scapularis TaxID=6945 RepID=UPI001A9EC3BD|nr:teneurin-a-like [Ixodes scapularis]
MVFQLPGKPPESREHVEVPRGHHAAATVGHGHQHDRAPEQDGRGSPDVTIHTAHAILNIRYGTAPHRERLRLLWHAKKHAVSQRWAQERQVLLTDQHGGALGWTDKDKEHILRTGSVPGYREDYYHNVDSFPELADDPSNIVFRKVTRKR